MPEPASETVPEPVSEAGPPSSPAGPPTAESGVTGVKSSFSIGLSGTSGIWLSFSGSESLSATSPSSMPAEPSPNAAASECLSCSNFASLSAEIANSTMNSASSTVNMSA